MQSCVSCAIDFPKSDLADIKPPKNSEILSYRAPVYQLTCITLLGFPVKTQELNPSASRQLEPTSFNSHSSWVTCFAHIPWTLTTVNLKLRHELKDWSHRFESPGWRQGSEWINWTRGTHPSIMAVEMPLNAALNLHLLQWSCSVAGNRLHWATSKCVCASVCLSVCVTLQVLTRRASTFPLQ